MSVFSGLRQVPLKKAFKDLNHEISEDNVFNGAAALAYYLMLAIFPMMIFILSVLPYLPIENLHQAVMDFISQSLPAEAAKTFEGAIAEITQDKKGGLLSFGAIATLWAASAGLYAIMQQLNITYDVKETRPFWKARGTAILLTLLFAVLVAGAFALIVFGGILQEWLGDAFGLGGALLFLFAALRWVIIGALFMLGFALIYYFGPDVQQKFKFISPGAIIGTIVLAVASLAFRFYVDNFGNYSASYGSLGAVIILMLWLYIAGLVLLLGSEINSLAEHYAPEGKDKGEKLQPENSRGRKSWMYDAKPAPLPGRAPGFGPAHPAFSSKLDLIIGFAALGMAMTKRKA